MINILDYCEIVGINLVIQYISKASRNDDLWCCSLDHVWQQLPDGSGTSFHSFGNSPDEAIHNFVEKAAGKTLYQHWGSTLQKEINVPKRLFYSNEQSTQSS